jgi:FixJ family two-component response regulator
MCILPNKMIAAKTKDRHVSIVDEGAQMRDCVYDLLTLWFAYSAARYFLADVIPQDGCLITNIRIHEVSGRATRKHRLRARTV